MPEYREGPKAKQDFERTMVALFRVQKTTPIKKTAKPKKRTSRKSEHGKDV